MLIKDSSCKAYQQLIIRSDSGSVLGTVFTHALTDKVRAMRISDSSVAVFINKDAPTQSVLDAIAYVSKGAK